MIGDFIQLSKGVAAWPAAALFAAYRRRRIPKHSIVHVQVDRIEDVLDRQLWLQDLRGLAGDDRVEGVVFAVRTPPGGWAASQDLRQVIATLRTAGKATYAFVEAPGNGSIWIASACERVFAVPTGQVQLVGVGTELMFFGQALERLGLQPDLEAAGAYKSFGESFTRSFASAANLEATTALIGDLHEQLVQDIASDRGVEISAVQAMLEHAPLAAVQAVDAGLVDQILYQDQLDDWLTEQHGERCTKIEFSLWSKLERGSQWLNQIGTSMARVAVLHLQGNILMEDKSGTRRIRARTVAPLLEELRNDDDVKAVVLHIDSPGGDVLASDLIWREVEQLRTCKPVVACFEDVSASGGVYLAAPATEIIVRPATITGSIGVFGGKMVAAEGLRKLGVSTQSILAAPNATLFSPSVRFTDPQRLRFREQLQRIYDGFVHRVAAGRRQPEASVEPHCRGRVWTGRQALERGLVDRLGGLQDAVNRARLLAGLDADARRQDLSGQPTLNWLQQLIHDARSQLVPGMAQLGAAGVLYNRVLEPELGAALDFVMQHEGRVLAMLPFHLQHPR